MRRETVIRAMAMFWRMLATVRLAREMASGSLSRLSPIRAMSAVSTATADPAAPIATPMLAAAWAGPSLKVLNDDELALGEQPSVDFVNPGGLADGVRDQRGVTGQHDNLLHAGSVQVGHHVCGVQTHLVGHRQHTKHGVIDSNDHRGAPG